MNIRAQRTLMAVLIVALCIGNITALSWAKNARDVLASSNVVPLQNLIPSKDNVYTLGSETRRWKRINIGTESLSFIDSSTDSKVSVGVDNGALVVRNAQGIQVGPLRFTPTGIKALDSKADITIGNPGDSGYLATARGIKFPDGSLQTSAAQSTDFKQQAVCVNAIDGFMHLATCQSLGIHGSNFTVLIK